MLSACCTSQQKATSPLAHLQVHQLKDDNQFLRKERDQIDARTRALERKLKAATSGASNPTAAASGGGAPAPNNGAAAAKAEPDGKASKASANSGLEGEDT